MPSTILSSLQPHPCSTPKTLKPSIQLAILAMKDRPTLSSYGAIYVPPHHRRRSVVTSAPPAAAAAKLREHHGAVLNPRTPAAATLPRSQTPLPEHQIPDKGNSRFVSAYDDGVSEEGSDREFEAPSLPVSLFT